MASCKVSSDIPEELRNITLAYTCFYKVASSLEQLEGQDPVSKHVVIATSLSHLMELCEKKVLRFTKLQWKDIKKIVVHHEFNPLQLYIVLLRHCNSAVILSYTNFKTLHEWENITNIESTDLKGAGAPSLHLTDTSGQVNTLSTIQMSAMFPSSSQNLEIAERGKADAAAALAHRLKGGIRHVEQLNSQRRIKETFIKRKLSVMQAQLQGLNISEDNTLMPVLVVAETGVSGEHHPIPITAKTSALKIISVRNKVVHNKWVIGLNIINNSERTLICHPQLMLHVSKGTLSLSYTTKILKVVQRKVPVIFSEASNESRNVETKITIEKLDPPILRPKKKASILGICTIPNFTESVTVVCSGLVTYTSKTLNPEATQDLVPERTSYQQLQLSFEPVELNACDLQNYHISIEKNYGQAGVPFTSVALVGGSVYNQVSITSLASSLRDLLTRLGKHFDIIKVAGVSNMYCFYPEECHPLRFSAITISPLNSHKVELGLYTRDESQALLLVHSLKATLPSDVSVHPIASTNQNHDEDENTRQQLFAKMKEAATYVMEGYEVQAYSHKKFNIGQINPCISNVNKDESTSDMYNTDREAISEGKECVTFNANVYKDWRKKLYKIQSEMDELYIKYLN